MEHSMEEFREYKEWCKVMDNLKNKAYNFLLESEYVEGYAPLWKLVKQEGGRDFVLYQALHELEREGKISLEKGVGEKGRTLIYLTGKRPNVPTLEEKQKARERQKEKKEEKQKARERRRKEKQKEKEEIKTQLCEYLKDHKNKGRNETMRALGLSNKRLFQEITEQLERDGVIRTEERGLKVCMTLNQRDWPTTGPLNKRD